MSSFNNFLNASGNEYVRLLLIFVLVLIAVFLIFFLVRAVLRMIRGGSFGGKRARQPRLGFVEEAEIDARRRLILIRRDNIEHLILLGPTQDLVVESNIMKAFDGQKISPPTRENAYREPPPVVGEEQLSLKASARKAAGELQILPPAPPAPTRLSPPERPAPVAAKAVTPPAHPPQQARFVPIPTTQPAPTPVAKPLETTQYEAQVISLAPMPPVQKVSFDSLEEEMAALLGHKKA